MPSIRAKATIPRARAPQRQLSALTYNVENLANAKRDPKTGDTQFFPEGEYNWTEPKLVRKLENLGRVIRSLNHGRGPDLFALNELRSKSILERLRDTQLKGLGYQTLVHFDTKQGLGFENGFLSRLPLLKKPVLHPMHREGDPLWEGKHAVPTLEVVLKWNGKPLTVFVHHGVGTESERGVLQRTDAAHTLRKILRRRLKANPNARIMVMGDFNANPGEMSFGPRGLGASPDAKAVLRGKKDAVIFNTVAAIARKVSGKPGARFEDNAELDQYVGQSFGTRFRQWSSTWHHLDNILVSPALLKKDGLHWVPGSTRIVRDAFLLDAEGHPRSTFASGKPQAQSKVEEIGVSDHLPVFALFSGE